MAKKYEFKKKAYKCIKPTAHLEAVFFFFLNKYPV